MPSDGRFTAAIDEIRQALPGQGGRVPPIEPPRARDDDDGMEARVKRLEDDVRAIRTDLMTINGRLANVEGKLDLLVAQVNGIAAKMPSAWQLVGAVLALLTGLIGLMAGAAKLAQLLKFIPG